MRTAGFIACTIAAFSLAACNDRGSTGEESYAAAPPPPPGDARYFQPATSDTITMSGLKRSAPAPSEPQGGEMLAYAYQSRLELPAKAVAPVMEAHRSACAAAGSATCQILTASLDAQRETYVTAQLRFRAAPAYMTSFRASLAKDAAGAGGRLVATDQSVEDLTRQITDLSARLDAQKTLRTRLTELLNRAEGDVGDLLEVERELARVQGEIESMTSQLAYLEGRVSMNLMTVRYESIYEAIAPERARPLAEAFRDFVGILSESLAELVRFTAAALPWLIIGLPLLWLLVRRFTRRKA
jgi:hypothetical protein